MGSFKHTSDELKRSKVNWKKGFEDLLDVDSDSKPKAKKVGQPGYAIIGELVIKCVTRSTGKRRWRCSAPGCQESWASRQPQRVLSHATEECRFTLPSLRDRALAQSSKLSLGHQVEQLNAAAVRQVSESTGTTSQPSVLSIVSAEGRSAKQTRFDLHIVNFISVAQLPPSKVDSPEFHDMIHEANPHLTPKLSSHIARSRIPMESARICGLSMEELKGCTNLTISFDGGSGIKPQSFTTVHVTNPDTRVPHLMGAVEASSISHTGRYYQEELEKVCMYAFQTQSICSS